MKNFVVPALSLSLLALSGSTLAADSSHAGQKGYVAAYDTDGSVIDVEKCAAKGKYSWDYVSCGKAFRAKINDRLCSTLGKGNHKWLYRVGNSKSRISNTARCK